jgi:2'-5' RNA ligase
MWRLFVAIELPETWREALRMYQEQIRAQTATVAGISWSRPEGFHMTLKFIGPFEAAQLPELRNVLNRAIPASPEYRLQMGPTYMFGGRPVPRVLATRYSAPDAVESLVRRLDSSLVPLGVPKETRRFLPHITLARIRPEIERSALDSFISAIRQVRDPEAPPFDVKQLSLMRSHLGPGGSRYERVTAFPPES